MAHEGDFWSCHQGSWNKTKFVLRSISFVASIIIIGVSINTSIRLVNWAGYEYYILLDWWFTLAVTLLSIALDFSELSFSFLWKRNPGLPPGWHIGIELVLLGGNIVGLVFIIGAIPQDNQFLFDNPPQFIRPLRITTIAFLALFTAVRFILFVIACVDTHRYHAAAQVEMIVQALRQQNINDPATTALVHNAIQPNRPPITLQEYPYMQRPSYEPRSQPELYPELSENQKFLADLPTLLNRT
ncbi:hypothetical protein F5Y12DRAFT_712187 [Xylaria sp. FL1777]|nr:hypothetical protein F5Y12DRAFT_712187 [Xylaria sp. FL1777]